MKDHKRDNDNYIDQLCTGEQQVEASTKVDHVQTKRIVRMNSERMIPPPPGSSVSCQLFAVITARRYAWH